VNRKHPSNRFPWKNPELTSAGYTLLSFSVVLHKHSHHKQKVEQKLSGSVPYSFPLCETRSFLTSQSSYSMSGSLAWE